MEFESAKWCQVSGRLNEWMSCDGRCVNVLRSREEESKETKMQEYILLGSTHACLIQACCHLCEEATVLLSAGRKEEEGCVERAHVKL